MQSNLDKSLAVQQIQRALDKAESRRQNAIMNVTVARLYSKSVFDLYAEGKVRWSDVLRSRAQYKAARTRWSRYRDKAISLKNKLERLKMDLGISENECDQCTAPDSVMRSNGHVLCGSCFGEMR